MNLNKISRRNFLCTVGLTTAAALTACGSSASSAAASCRTGGAHRLCRRLPH